MPLELLPAEPTDAQRTERDPDFYGPLQAVTRELAFDPDGWTAERRERIRQFFDQLAPEWHTRGGPERTKPLRDALARGGVPRRGVCLEVGSGTGLQTAELASHFEHVISLDLSDAMLALSPRPAGVSLARADASRLPVRPGGVDCVVAVNMFLFPAEYGRVLRPGGSIVFVATNGDQTPIYLPATDVVRSLQPSIGEVRAVASQAGFGTWTVVVKGPA